VVAGSAGCATDGDRIRKLALVCISVLPGLADRYEDHTTGLAHGGRSSQSKVDMKGFFCAWRLGEKLALVLHSYVNHSLAKAQRRKEKPFCNLCEEHDGAAGIDVL